MPPISDFFEAVDAAWQPPPERLLLQIIGSTALMLQTGYSRVTRDSDVLETAVIDSVIRDRLLALAGAGSAIHTRHRLYLDIVGSGIPFLPQQPRWHPCAALAHLTHFDVQVLAIVDTVVSKLKRFIARDADDIDAMIQLQAVPHDDFVARFRAAVDYFSYGSGADDLPTYVARFHQVERDMFGVVETPIELPHWIA